MPSNRVVVVGTTADYIHLIERRLPGRALFLTDQAERARACEPEPDDASEVLADLAIREDALAVLRAHLHWHDIVPTGVACFDDESMALAAAVARMLSLPYVGADAVPVCRSKHESKRRWRQAGLPCPRAELVRSEAEALAFQRTLGRAVVLKPLTGSGSELTFICRGEGECRTAFRQLRDRLCGHRDARMYAAQGDADGGLDPHEVFVAEEFVEGDEYSCDFLVHGDEVAVVRVAAKIPAARHSFGTTMAYVVPAELPAPIERSGFHRQLLRAARAVGIDRSVCMLDFIVRDGEALMLEIAPRPGGDCLPALIRHSSGVDMLELTLDYAEGRAIALPPAEQWQPCVGLRLIASQPGRIRCIDTRALEADPHAREVHLKHGRGHCVVLPPHDYDSRILGHVILDPQGIRDLPTACAELAARLSVQMEPLSCPVLTVC